MDKITHVTAENVNEIHSRMIKKEQDMFDFNKAEAERITNEIKSKIFSSEKLSIYELKIIATKAATYELFLYDILDLPCDFHFSQHKDYSERLKTIRKKCIKKLKKAQIIIERKIRYKEAEIETHTPEATKGRKPKTVKTFSEYFLPQYREMLPRQLKNEFTNETGRDIRMLIDVLKKKEIITIAPRGNKQFHNAMEMYFGRDIATYQAVFDPAPNDFKESDIFPIKTRVESIL